MHSNRPISPRRHTTGRHRRFIALVAFLPVLAVLSGAGSVPTTAATTRPPDVADASSGSIVFVRNNDIWISAPDGSRQVQLTAGRKFAAPTMADDGSIVALGDDNHLYHFDGSGKLLGEPVITWLGLNGGSGFAGPFRPRVSPDGTKVAYTFLHSQGIDEGGHSRIEGGVAYTAVDQYTDPNALGVIKGWDNPSWLDDTHTMSFSPDFDLAAPELTNVAVHELGHADPSALDDLAHAFTWFTDTSAPTLLFAEQTRAGDKLAAGYDGFGPVQSIRLYSVAEAPVPGADTAAPVFRCQLTDPSGGGFDTLSWSPDGESLAYQAGGDIFVVHVGDIHAGCGGLGSPHLVLHDAEAPWWGRVDAPSGDATGSTTSTTIDGPPAGPTGSAYVPVVPVRLLETRASEGQTGYTGPKPTGGQTIQVHIPDTASAAVLNLVGTNTTTDGYLTVWPCGQPRPNASNANLTTGTTTANLVISKVGTDNNICIYTQNPTDLIADLNGYFPT